MKKSPGGRHRSLTDQIKKFDTPSSGGCYKEHAMTTERHPSTNQSPAERRQELGWFDQNLGARNIHAELYAKPDWMNYYTWCLRGKKVFLAKLSV